MNRLPLQRNQACVVKLVCFGHLGTGYLRLCPWYSIATGWEGAGVEGGESWPPGDRKRCRPLGHCNYGQRPSCLDSTVMAVLMSAHSVQRSATFAPYCCKGRSKVQWSVASCQPRMLTGMSDWFGFLLWNFGQNADDQTKVTNMGNGENCA